MAEQWYGQETHNSTYRVTTGWTLGTRFNHQYPITKIRAYAAVASSYTSTPTMALSVYEVMGDGSWNLLHESEGFVIGSSGVWYEYDFSDKPLTAGKTYIGAIETIGSSSNHDVLAFRATSNVVPDHLTQLKRTDGSIHTEHSNYDYRFQVWGDPEWVPDTGPEFLRNEDGVWVPATVRKLDGGQWVEVTGAGIKH